MTPRRLYGPVVLALLAVSGGAWLGLGRTWGSVALSPEGLPADTLQVTGTDAVPLATALAVVLVTSALGVLATRGRGRQVLGGLVVVAGLGGAVLAVTSSAAVAAAARRAAEESPAFTGQDLPAPDGSAWPYVVAVAFVACAGLGGVVVRFGRAWPAMGGRFEKPSVRVDDDPWKALDEGRDPTL